MSRASAEERAADLQADGWDLQLVEIEPDGQ
jgi:hypothetical protein